MKKALFLLIVMLSAVEASAQKHGRDKIDSLSAILKTAKEDTAKVNTLIALAYEIASNSPDTAIYFGNEALALATKLNDKMGIADAHNNIGLGLDYLGKYKEALQNLNVSLKLYEELLTSSTASFKSKILKGKGKAYNIMGIVFDDQGNLPEGFKNYFASLRIYQEIRDKEGMAKTYHNIGVLYMKQDNFVEALKFYLAALALAEELGNQRGIAYIKTNIGNIYKQQGNYAEALKNFFTALKIHEESGNKKDKALILNDIGTIYSDQGNDAEALKKYFSALKLNEELGTKSQKASNLVNIGIVYNKQGNYNEALKNYFVALKLAEEIGFRENMVISYIKIGDSYLALNKNSEASRYLNKGLSLAKEIGDLVSIQESYIGMSALDSAQGNFKQSRENYKMYVIYRDSMINKENTEKTVQIQMQYEFDKKELLAKAELEKKDAIALKELQKQKLLRNALIGGFVLLLILGVIISIIMIQYREIRLIKKERNRISGELHDDIGADLNRITMISQLLHNKTNQDEEMQEKLMNISEAGKKVLGNIGEIIWTMNPQKDNLESLVAYIRRFVTEYLEMNGIEVNIEFPDEIPAKSVSDKYRRNIFLVIKEAIYNITKYSKATRVQLSMNLEKRTAGIEIHDNGIGFSVKEKQNWGNGLRNMNQRMKDIGGNFRISSGKDQGTLINLNFPVH